MEVTDQLLEKGKELFDIERLIKTIMEKIPEDKLDRLNNAIDNDTELDKQFIKDLSRYNKELDGLYKKKTNLYAELYLNPDIKSLPTSERFLCINYLIELNKSLMEEDYIRCVEMRDLINDL